MSLTSRDRGRLMDNINVEFNSIGKDKNTRMPEGGTDNRSPTAYEYFVASHVLARARARFDDAKKHAIAAGVIFDHTEYPREGGTNEQIYLDEFVAIWLSVRNPAVTVSAKKMRDWLIDKGVDQGLVNEAFSEASTPSRPAHDFKVSLVAADMSAEGEPVPVKEEDKPTPRETMIARGIARRIVRKRTKK